MNADWGCSYRIKNGIFYIMITTGFANDQPVGRFSLGTISMNTYGAYNVPYCTCRDSFGRGYLVVSHSAPNMIEYDVTGPGRWYDAFLSIPVGYM